MAMYLAITTCVLLSVVLGLSWPALAESLGRAKVPSAAGSRPVAPESLEGALAAQLADRVITRDQYRRAMEFVAAGPRSS